jgi:hypothetical protein
MWRSKHGDEVSFQFLKLEEDESIHGNLLGFLEAHKNVLNLYPHASEFPDTVVYIHDAGMSKRIFPLQYATGKPSKALIRVPRGPAIAQTFYCMAHNLPFLKDTVMIIPIDQFFSYFDMNVEKLRERIEHFGMVMLQVDVPVASAVGQLGVTQLDPTGKITAFFEKPKDPAVIPLVREGTALGNTFQMYFSRQGMKGLLDAFEEFRKEEKKLSKELDETGWDFNGLVSEALTLPDEKLNIAQRAFKKHLKKHKVNLGGLETKGTWQDWASSLPVYFDFVRAHAPQMGVPDLEGNIWIRTESIKIVTGNISNCIFIDCDTVDLHGHFSDCVFVNCKKCRIAVATSAKESIFANMFETNALSVAAKNQVLAWGRTGRRKIFSITGFDEDYRELYDGPGSFVKGWWNT